MMAARSHCASPRRTRSRRLLCPSRHRAALASSTTPAPSQKRQRSVTGRPPSPATKSSRFFGATTIETRHHDEIPPGWSPLSRSALNGIAPNIFFPTLAIFPKRDGEGGIRIFAAQLPMRYREVRQAAGNQLPVGVVTRRCLPRRRRAAEKGRMRRCAERKLVDFLRRYRQQ
jgi:hypothetical protein